MTAVVALAAVITGIVAGWWLRMIIITAEVSRSQEKMQRKIRYWQSEAARARFVARQLGRQLAAHAGPALDADGLSHEDGGHPDQWRAS